MKWVSQPTFTTCNRALYIVRNKIGMEMNNLQTNDILKISTIKTDFFNINYYKNKTTQGGEGRGSDNLSLGDNFLNTITFHN